MSEDNSAIIPEDIPLPKANPAETSPTIKPGQKVATEEFVNVRMEALSNLMQVSMKPALALLPANKRKQINTAFGEFEALVKDEPSVMKE